MTQAPHVGAIITKLCRWVLSSRLLRVSVVVLGCSFLAATGSMIYTQQRLPDRFANKTLQLPLSPPNQSSWTSEDAFPNLSFFEPTCVAEATDGSGRVLVLERRGTVQLFVNEPDSGVKTKVVDFSNQVLRTPYEDDGAYGLVLHPEFGSQSSSNRGYFYVMYTARVGSQRFDRLSRFTLRGDKATDETILIEQLDEDLWHNGGGLAFGADGFLYVGVGDEGTNGDGLSNGQRIDRDLFCGVLRIDVDRRGGKISHPPRRQPETGRTDHYFIPSDNPFVGVPNALEEFWCHGLRNPFRLSFDRQTGSLWSGDVGHLSREEVNVIRRGGNYGWSYAEGTLPFSDSYLAGEKPSPYHGIECPPLFEYAHVNGNTCVIGGFVYRGSEFPELEGKYLFADNGSGRLWALESDGKTVVDNSELFTFPAGNKTGIASIEPNASGEPWIVVLGAAGQSSGKIHRLVRADPTRNSTLPQNLSDTGIFSDLTKLTPNKGVIEYTINASQAAHGADVRRWLVLPGNGSDQDSRLDRIAFDADSAWKFPIGTVFVQHFEMPPAPSHPKIKRRIETRILRIDDRGGVYGANYRWNESDSEAELVTSPTVAELTRLDNGSPKNFEWQFVSSNSCTSCHNANAGHVLGVNARQLNRTHAYGFLKRPLSQLAEWNRVGMFHQPLSTETVQLSPQLVASFDPHADLDHRARSFLDVNCSACHRPGGARSHFDARYSETAAGPPIGTTPHQADFGLQHGKIVVAGDPFRSVLYYRLAKLGPGRMPFAATQPLEPRELGLIRQWIQQLPVEPIVQPVSLSRSGDTELIDQLTSGAIPADAYPDLLDSLLSTTTSAFQLWQKVYEGSIRDPLRSEIVAVAISSKQQSVRDLFERFVPREQRTLRLGVQFDPLDVLRLSGDAGRGRDLYLNLDGLGCRSCHSLKKNERLVGPSLWKIGAKYDRTQMLRQITHPTDQVADEYRSWRVLTLDGIIVSGMLTSESPTEIVLTDAMGKRHLIARDDIDELLPQKKSLMPEQLLQSLTAQQAADLIELLRSLQ